LNPVLTQTDRNGLVETIHRGSVVVIGPEGQTILQLGDADAVTYPRSAMKLVQVLPLLMSGAVEDFGLTDEEVALMCGSHNAEPRHLETARSILKKCGAAEKDLACGAHLPLGEEARHALIRNHHPPHDLHNNCSGKHAGFLALARHRGHPLKGYLVPDHPVQQRIRSCVATVFEVAEQELHRGTDGCSAPNYAMPLRNMALGFRNLVAPAFPDEKLNAACRKVVTSVTTHPFMVAGTGRYCTDLMIAAQGRVIAKLGADGVYCLGLPEEGMGIAIKLDDGATGPQYNVAQSLLEALEALPKGAKAMLEEYRDTPILNCKNLVTGYRRTTVDFRTWLY
jgi:L-asparaginase II